MSSMFNGDTTLDRISHLPKDIIEKILVHLPLKVAIRTSILSRDWRYAWSSIPHLAFSSQEFFRPICSYSRVYSDYELVDIINHVLLLHQGPIHRFELSTDLKRTKDIDGWLLFLSRNDIKEIVLQKWEREMYELPSCLLSCKGLRSLSLHNCKFRPVHFQGFPLITTLSLRRTSISQNGLESLITNSPLLNDLYLRDVFYIKGLKVCSPTLVNFTLFGDHIDLSFENVPLLATIFVCFRGKTDNYYAYPGVICKLFRILNHLPSIKKIVLSQQTFKVWTYGDLLIQVPFTYQLKHFRAAINMKDIQQIHAIVLLCRSCPLLLTLALEAYIVENLDERTSIEKFWDAQQGFDCLFSHLKSVEITGVSCISELPFIKIVLANAPVLEIANIGFAYSVKGEPHIYKDIKKFRRLSPTATIKFLKKRTENGLYLWQYVSY